MVKDLSKIKSFVLRAETPQTPADTGTCEPLITVPNPLYGNNGAAAMIEIGVNRALELFQDKHGKTT